MNWDTPAPELAPASRPNAAGLDLDGLRALVAGLGESPFRASQIHQGLYRMRWASWDRFTALSKDLRARLEAEVRLEWPAIVEGAASEDGSTKHAFRLEDGALVEGVHMPYGDRTTLCLSSQVGCAMGCTFCATGLMGIKRNLTPTEIVGQVVAMLNHHAHPEGRPVNLVFMGMGEPLHNLDNLMAAFKVLADPKGLAIPPRRVTVSTSGLLTGIRRLGAYKPRPRLALSLNATTDEYRSRIMPVNRVWGLEALAAELGAFPLEHGERITLEYVLLRDVTDSPEDGRRLAAFAARFPSKVNLIPFNPHEGSGFQPPEESRISELLGILSAKGVTASVRRSRGQDVAGACGQLVREHRTT
ncbi:MAG TPA: 23S rRNA (adenine(2503)-C(2))-methyltransferase RlmN [Holophaga sp.]|nr:23S rRNA (adenine(2503)-C(2))-methyltransferase RlmN [Holophaga sp.]